MEIDTNALPSKLGVYVLSYRGEDARTRTETVRRVIEDFLAGLNIGTRINAEKLRSVWDLLLQGDAEARDPSVRLNKEQLAWPIVVQVCSLASDDHDLNDRDDDICEAVCGAYSALIDDATERFELVAKIEFDFAEYRCMSSSKELASDRRAFIDARYGDYLDEIGVDGLDSEVAEVLAKQVIRKVLLRQRVISTVREGMSLVH